MGFNMIQWDVFPLTHGFLDISGKYVLVNSSGLLYWLRINKILHSLAYEVLEIVELYGISLWLFNIADWKMTHKNRWCTFLKGSYITMAMLAITKGYCGIMMELWWHKQSTNPCVLPRWPWRGKNHTYYTYPVTCSTLVKLKSMIIWFTMKIIYKCQLYLSYFPIIFIIYKCLQP